jgi:ABC-type transport system substrate-binding protein
MESNEPRQLNQSEIWQLRPMYEYLIGVDAETGNLIPQLATEWTLDPAEPAYRFKLRTGIPFHGGHGNFGAQDVVFTWTDLTQPDSRHGQSPYWRSVVKSIEIVSDAEVVFHLTRPDANFLRAISEAEGGMEIRSKAHADELRGTAQATGSAGTMATPPIAGTGPYQFKERVQGQYLRFERVAYQHWRATPDFPQFEFRFQRESSSRLAALLAGEVQITNLPSDLTREAERRGFRVIQGRLPALRSYLSISCCYMKDPNDPSQGWMYPNSPLMDVRVRKALDKAINRDELNKAFFDGKGQPLYVNHFYPNGPGWNPEWAQRFPEEYGYDPAKAKALLAEAGQSNLVTNMIANPIPQYSGAEDVGDAIAGYWRAIGVTVEHPQMEPAEVDSLGRQQKLNNDYRMAGTSASQLLGVSVFNSGIGLGTRASMEDPDTDAVLRQIWVTLDEKRQGALWRQLGDMMFERHMSVPLFWLPSEVVVSPALVSDYVFPGSITGMTHVQNVRAASVTGR